MPIFMVRQAEAYERMIPNWDKDMFTKLGMEMDKYFKLMKRIAIAYNNAADVAAQDELKQSSLPCTTILPTKVWLTAVVGETSIITVTVCADSMWPIS